MANAPQWLDTSGMNIDDAVATLFKLSGARDYAYNMHDYMAHGWKGQGRRFIVDDGFVTVHADIYCPRRTLWALPQPDAAQQLKAELTTAQAEIADLRGLLSDILFKLKARGIQ